MRDVKNWMDAKQLKLNEDKSECLLVGKKNKAFGNLVKPVIREIGEI